MPQDSHIPFYHTTIRRKLQEVFKIFLRKLCGVKFPSKCNSKCCCCGCSDNLRICLLADVRPAPAVPCGAACLPCRPPALPLACFVAPIPPPALAERSSPPGKGEIFCFLMQGASPLASPRAEPGRHWEMGANHAPCGAACLVCCLPTVPLACFPAPIPQPPSRREGGDFLFSYARGFAPCIPEG